jgi:ADP-heptose:LPS heptosyltransferase
MMNKKTKFLIIRFSSIGDIVLTTPVIRCLKQQFDGNVEIHYLTKQTFIPLLESNPYINKLHSIVDNISEVRHELIEENFDFIIDLHRNIRTLKVKRMLKVPQISFDKLNWEKWIMVNFKVDKLPHIHIVDRYLDTLGKWNIVNDDKGLDFFIDENDCVVDLPDEFKNGYIAISVGATYATKTLPKEKLRSLVQKINKPVILLGSKADIEKADFVSKDLASPVLNGCGRYRINQSAYLIKNARVVIAHDTGLMHIASAFNKYVVSIWGNTIPEFGMYPYMPEFPDRSKIFEINNLKCRPCSKLGYNKCPKKHFKCMEMIDLNNVVDQVNLWF